MKIFWEFFFVTPKVMAATGISGQLACPADRRGTRDRVKVMGRGGEWGPVRGTTRFRFPEKEEKEKFSFSVLEVFLEKNKGRKN